MRQHLSLHCSSTALQCTSLLMFIKRRTKSGEETSYILKFTKKIASWPSAISNDISFQVTEI